MSRQIKQPPDLPWDKRPLTSRDWAITISLILFSCIAASIIFLSALEPPTALASPASAPTSSQPVAQNPGPGQAIFEQKCITCHTIGGGIIVGPDLQGVTERRDRDWLLRWIMEPDKMLAEGDPIATEMLAEFNNIAMPPMGLSPADAENVLAYLANPGDAASLAATANTLPPGDPNRGKALFSGAADLQNGAPACISCHSTTGIGSLGGGTLGPDLTNVYERYGDAGLPATLQNLPFPTMQGIFDTKPLTDAEAADLYAYFVQTNQATAQTLDYTFVIIGLVGCAVLILLSQLIWRKRLKAVRQPLLGGAK